MFCSIHTVLVKGEQRPMEEKAPRPTKTGKRRAKKPIYYTESGYLGLERTWKILQPEGRLSPRLARM